MKKNSIQNRLQQQIYKLIEKQGFKGISFKNLLTLPECKNIDRHQLRAILNRLVRQKAVLLDKKYYRCRESSRNFQGKEKLYQGILVPAANSKLHIWHTDFDRPIRFFIEDCKGAYAGDKVEFFVQKRHRNKKPTGKVTKILNYSRPVVYFKKRKTRFFPPETHLEYRNRFT